MKNLNIGTEPNGSLGIERLVHSTPGSPEKRTNSFEVIGSAESLVGRVNFYKIINLKKLLIFFFHVHLNLHRF